MNRVISTSGYPYRKIISLSIIFMLFCFSVFFLVSTYDLTQCSNETTNIKTHSNLSTTQAECKAVPCTSVPCSSVPCTAVQCIPSSNNEPSTELTPTTPTPISTPKLRITRKEFPQLKPQLCIGILSCRRYDLLQLTLDALIEHLETFEPDVKYEIAIMDNGNNLTEFNNKILTQYQIEKVEIATANYGIAFGLNELFFSMCRSPFQMALEDDWLWVKDRVKGRKFIKAGMEILSENPKYLGVFYRQSFSGFLVNPDPKDETYRPPASLFKKHGEFDYIEIQGDAKNVFTYANGGVMYETSRLRSLGRHEPEDVAIDTEFSIKDKAMQLDYTSILFRTDDSYCGIHTYCWEIFQHLGGGRHVETKNKK